MCVCVGTRLKLIQINPLNSWFFPTHNKPLSTIVKYNDANETLSSLHYPLLQSFGRAQWIYTPGSLHDNEQQPFGQMYLLLKIMIFSIVMLVFKGRYLYIPRAHTHILTHFSREIEGQNTKKQVIWAPGIHSHASPPEPGAGTMEPGPMSSIMMRQRTVPWCFVK